MIGQARFLASAISITPTLPLQQKEPPLDGLINVISLLIIIVVVTFCMVAFFIILVAILPKINQQTKTILYHAPWRAFFIGLANYLFLGGISLLLLSTGIPPVAFIGLIIAAFLITITVIGLTGLIMLIGERLIALSGRELSALKQVVWGTIVVELAALLPFVGWFLLTPILLMTAFGATVLGWRSRRQAANGWRDET